MVCTPCLPVYFPLHKYHLWPHLVISMRGSLLIIKYHNRNYVSIFSDSWAVSHVKLEAILQDHEGASAHGRSMQQTFDKGKKGTSTFRFLASSF